MDDALGGGGRQGGEWGRHRFCVALLTEEAGGGDGVEGGEGE